MNDLLAQVIAAHGGIGRWDTFKRVTATVVTGGGLWPMKGLEQDPNSREETVTLHEEIASVSPLFLLSANRTGTQLSRLIVSRSKPPRGRCQQAPRSQSLFRWPRDEHAMGSASECLLQRLCDVDLPRNAIPFGHARLQGR